MAVFFPHFSFSCLLLVFTNFQKIAALILLTKQYIRMSEAARHFQCLPVFSNTKLIVLVGLCCTEMK